MTTEQERFWMGEFGDAYTKRNRVDWRARIPFWKTMLDETGARSVSEFGCNAGWNLSAIRRCYADIVTLGIDINESAVDKARIAGLLVSNKWKDDYAGPAPAELVFTSGVLIHIPPSELESIMRKIVDISYDYILAIEYDSQSGEEEEINYRGHADRLWRRDYGKLYQSMGLDLIASGDAGPGFDKCTYWLLRKP